VADSLDCESLLPSREDIRIRLLASRNKLERRVLKIMFILIASIEVGPDVDRIVEATGLDAAFVHLIDRRMRKSGLWVADHLNQNPSDDLDAITCVLVADGLLVLDRKKDHERPGSCCGTRRRAKTANEALVPGMGVAEESRGRASDEE
jgi:hypothetical protein